MPASKPFFRLTAAFIESLHDEGITITWPGIEPVEEYECLDLNLLESAAEQPFQAGFGVDFYPTIYDKAACLFFSIAGGHIFRNGNKRTAVLALDQFLMANAYYLYMSNDAIKKMAEDTAKYRILDRDHKAVKAEIAEAIAATTFQFKAARKINPKFYRRGHKVKKLIRTDPLNQPGALPRQALR